MIVFDKYHKDGDYHWQWWAEKRKPYSFHADFCAHWVSERPCLDVGCGDGLITALLGSGVMGIDDCPLAVELACKHRVIARVKSAYDLNDSMLFKAIFLGDVIEHLEFPERGLCAIREALGDGGYLYVSTPPKQPTLSPYHYREYTPEELKDQVEKCGFKLVSPIIVKPEWVQMYGKFQKV